MFTNNLIAGAAGQGGSFYPFPIDQSLRFNDNDTAYLNRTPASTTNRKTWTWSGWVKLGNLGVDGNLFSTTGVSGASGIVKVQITSNNELSFYVNDGGDKRKQSSAVLRDTSAWYHVVAVLDTANATADDRMKIYINGERITNFSSSSNVTQNYEAGVSASGVEHAIGRYEYTDNQYFDGYLAEVNFIDGQALDPTSFGEFKSGVWIPKQYGGTYGTNGFHLTFADSGAIGDDTSGNTNDWTANNLAATDVLLDSPTNNFSVLNPLANAGSTFSEGNLQISFGNDGSFNPPVETGTISIPSSGKYYFEAVLTSATAMGVGIQANTDVKVRRGSVDYGVYYVDSGNIYTYVNGSGTIVDSTPATFTTGDVIGVAYDADTNSISWYKNGTLQTSYTPSTGHEFTPAYYAYASTVRANFGQDSSFAGNKTAQGNTDDNGIGDFYYAPPSGYLALCTANLPDPVIDPAQDDVPSNYFNTILYTGDGTNQSAKTGVGFQPDFVWVKARNNSYSHALMDAVRGYTKALESDTQNTEAYVGQVFDGFLTDGFKANGNFRTNGSGTNYTAWNWLAGNGTSSNTDGSITSTVSVNQKAGFSIVSYTGNGTSGATVGHGLSVAPELLIIKNRDAATNWRVYTTAIDGTMDSLFLNDTSTKVDSGSPVPTSTVFELGTNSDQNASGNDYICYAFHSVEGYSKFGTYAGNSSADGPFIYCGFRPALIIGKKITASDEWFMQDNKRGPYNNNQPYLKPNNSAAEINDGDSVDFLSNGFKWRRNSGLRNQSGQTYIFMAFAENPFKYANAR